MKTITLSEYEAIHPDFKGVWNTEREDIANWPAIRHQYMGKRTMMAGNGKCELLIEGLSLNIIDDRKPSPGPWTLQNLDVYIKDYVGSKTTFCIRDHANHCLATIGDVDAATEPHNVANARVMFAAPELLVMLQRLLDGVLRLPELPPTIAPLDIEQSLKAINKATVG